MTRPKEPHMSAGHHALMQVIESRYDGSKAEAGRAACAHGFPAAGEGEQRASNVGQAIKNLSNGYVRQPSIERLLWFQEYWEIPIRAWGE